MEDYSKMSNFEINSAVIEIHKESRISGEVVKYPHFADGSSVGLYHKDGDYYEWFNYCNNPSDAWPIIHGNDIMLNPNCADELWKAEQGFREKPSGFYDVATAHNKNPLRAAMIVFLMMRDEQCQKS